MHPVQREGGREPGHLKTRKTIRDATFFTPGTCLAVNALNIWHTFTNQ